MLHLDPSSACRDSIALICSHFSPIACFGTSVCVCGCSGWRCSYWLLYMLTQGYLCIVTGGGEVGSGRWVRLPHREGEADRAELQSNAHSNPALHLWGPGLERVLLVHRPWCWQSGGEEDDDALNNNHLVLSTQFNPQKLMFSHVTSSLYLSVFRNSSVGLWNTLKWMCLSIQYIHTSTFMHFHHVLVVVGYLL